MKMTKKWWWKETIPLDTTIRDKALDKLMTKMLRRIAKTSALKKSDIGMGGNQVSISRKGRR